jgi:Putative DNA-binding domain
VSGSGLRGARLKVGGADGGSKRLSSASTRARLPITSAPGPGAWVALHRDDVLLDRRVLDPAWRQANVEVEIDLATQVQVLVSRGEGPTVEFKRQLPAVDAQGPMKTISAFANGDGGVIIFGVDDNGQVVGVEHDDLPRAVDRLATLIGDWTYPPVDCSPQIVALSAASVVIVSIPPGAEPPYAVGTNDRKLVYYVRRGASSAPARPSDVRAAVRARIPVTTQVL